MVDLILTEEQTNVFVSAAGGPVSIRDANGKLLAAFEVEYTTEIIAELKRRARSPGPFYTGAQVQGRLRALEEEWQRTGGFDKAYMHEFLARLDMADPGHMRPKDGNEL